jgi:hypothetical protein
MVWQQVCPNTTHTGKLISTCAQVSSHWIVVQDCCFNKQIRKYSILVASPDPLIPGALNPRPMNLVLEKISS